MLVAKQVLDGLSSLLALSGDFSVIDPNVAYSEEVAGTKPIVELHISDGDFSDIGSSNIGKKMHSFCIELSVIASSSAKYDLSVIESPSSTDEQRATAIENGQRAANAAYAIAFQTFILAFGIINNRANYDFGLAKYSLKKKKFGKYKIDRHMVNGNLATVIGTSKIECTVEEDVSGVTPVESEDPVAIGEIDGDLPD
jgi:hypothetical protein